MNEADKWNYSLNNYTFTSTASLSKYANKKYDWVIWDEPQEVLSPKVLSQISLLKSQGNNIIGLTGSLSENNREKIKVNTGLEVIAEYTTEQGIQEGFITDYDITVMYCTLEKTKESLYKWYSDKMEEAKLLNDRIRLRNLSLGRMRLLHSSSSKKYLAKKVIKLFSGIRVLFFAHLTKFADDLNIPAYHSKNKDKQLLEDFCNGKGNHLVTLDMASTGITYVPISKCVIITFNSNPEELYQRINRITAFEYNNPSKKAEIFILCIKNTQEEIWLDKALDLLDRTKVKYIIT